MVNLPFVVRASSVNRQDAPRECEVDVWHLDDGYAPLISQCGTPGGATIYFLINNIVSSGWKNIAEDRAQWRPLGETYVQQWTWVPCLVHLCGCCEYVRGGDDADGKFRWKTLAAEFVGTCLLLFLTCLSTCGMPSPSPLYRAIASGFIVAFIVQSFEHISGAQLNPTVTLAGAVMGRWSPRAALAEAAAQLLGATAGAGLLRGLGRGLGRGDACLTLPAEGVGPYQAVAIEAVLGACLALANCASWDARNRCLKDSWPLRIGVTVVALSLTAGQLTGAGMNPARSFAPALWSNNWTHHWVYWAGPPGGAAAAAALYRAAWRAPPAAPARAAPSPALARRATQAAARRRQSALVRSRRL
ncbi:aquaporin AQPcic [Aphomia sociella]